MFAAALVVWVVVLLLVIERSGVSFWGRGCGVVGEVVVCLFEEGSE